MGVKLATLLSKAKTQGEVRIRRKDGDEFVVKPVRKSKSPLDVEGIRSVFPQTKSLTSSANPGKGRGRTILHRTYAFPIVGWNGNRKRRSGAPTWI